MNLFEEFADQSFRISASVRLEGKRVTGPPPTGPLMKITRRANLPAEATRIMLAIARREREVDLGGAVLIIPAVVQVTAVELAAWTFSPALRIQVNVKGFEVEAEVGVLELIEQDGRPCLLVKTLNTFKPNVLFIFDDSPIPNPEPNQAPEINWAALVQMSIMKANVPASRHDTVRVAAKRVHATGLVQPALTAVGASRPGTVRDSCKREAAAIYDQAKKSGAIGTGIIFWLTVGKWILMVLEWALYLSKQDTENADR